MTAATAATGAPRAGAPDRWREAWCRALEAVELDVEAAEALVEHLHSAREDEAPVEAPAAAWTPPALPGPIPGDLADRAKRLLERQLDVSRRLADAMALARSHRRALAKLDASEPPPVYVDPAL